MNNKIKKMSIEESLESLYLVYCILNQDLMTLDEIYQQLEQNLGRFTYFMKKTDYLLSLTGSILIKYPLENNFILKTKHMKNIYENLRNNKKIVSITDLYNIRTHVVNYDLKLRNFIVNRVDKNSMDALQNDHELRKYHNQMVNVRHSKKEINYVGNIENGMSNSANNTDQYESVELEKDDNDIDIDDRKWILPHVSQRPIKWGAQRSWFETEAPNFLDKNYKVSV